MRVSPSVQSGRVQPQTPECTILIFACLTGHGRLCQGRACIVLHAGLPCAALERGHITLQLLLQPLPSDAELEALPAEQRPEPRAYFAQPFAWRYKVRVRQSSVKVSQEVLCPHMLQKAYYLCDCWRRGQCCMMKPCAWNGPCRGLCPCKAAHSAACCGCRSHSADGWHAYSGEQCTGQPGRLPRRP